LKSIQIYLFLLLNKEYLVHQFGNGSDIYSVSFNGCKYIAPLDYVKTDTIKYFDGRNSINNAFIAIAKGYNTSPSDSRAREGFEIFIKWLIDKGVLTLSHTPLKGRGNRVSGEQGKCYPFLLSIEVTSACNLRCRHCYKEAGFLGASGHMDYEKFHEIIEFFKHKTPYINLTGGEAMTHPRIFDMINLVSSHFTTIVLSNGYGIGSMSDELLKNMPFTQLTLYGASKEDYNRKVGNSAGFDNFVSAVRALVRNDIDFMMAINLTKGVVMELDACLNLLCSLSVRRAKFSMATNFGRQINNEQRSDWVFTLEEKKQIAQSLAKYKDDLSEKINLEIFTEEDVTDFEVRKHNKKTFCSLSCFAGRGFMTISEKGILRPCTFLPEEIFSLGDLRDCSQNILGGVGFDFSAMLTKYEQYLESQGLSFEDIECSGFR